MINEFNVNAFCCEDISKIENYDKAVADKTQTWHCHHKNGIVMNMSEDQLKKNGLYYKRPAAELVFMTEEEHKRLHSTHKDLSHWTFKGRKRSALNKQSIKEGIKKHMTKEIAYKHGNGARGTSWWNNGIVNKRAVECPPGFVRGKLVHKPRV